MATIALLLDEDVRPLLGEILRERGYDAVHVLEVGRAGETDAEQLTYATSGGVQFSLTTSDISACLTKNTRKKARSTSASYFQPRCR